tara:strand:+ start:200 stop:454 length:255 start_codon:yes stop_codon:yes gene_type:complete
MYSPTPTKTIPNEPYSFNVLLHPIIDIKKGEASVDTSAPILAPAPRIPNAVALFSAVVHSEKTTCEAGNTGAHEIPKNSKLKDT